MRRDKHTQKKSTQYSDVQAFYDSQIDASNQGMWGILGSGLHQTQKLASSMKQELSFCPCLDNKISI